MTSPTARINALVSRFVTGQPVADFQRDFLAFHEGFDQSVLPEAQRDAYWAVYDLVYMARPDPGSPEESESGGLREATLRDRLRHFHLREPGPAAS